MKYILTLLTIISITATSFSQEEVFPGADEKTPSRAQYFSWINNTNEGATEEQTMINLDFFGWLKSEYGMQLDIYAFDAGAIDGKRFYGSIYSDRFKSQFPNGFDPIYDKAKSMDIRLGVWGGPDGFGETPQEERARIDQMVKLCKDYEFALFKFDAVCGPLRPEKEDAFIQMMKECRTYSPDLILLNHRVGLKRAEKYATTFLWGGAETYIDVWMVNNVTAPHHRAGALSRGLVPDLQRLTEDHGVCISSCNEYWDDDLILQAFNRSLILAPEIYGNPWLLRDDEYPKLARIYNLHRKYRDILVNGIVLPESYGPYPVSRGDESTRLISLRNLEWEPTSYTLKLDAEVGLEDDGLVTLVQLHPTEKIIGTFKKGISVSVEVLPFRSCLLLATTKEYDEPALSGVNYNVLKNLPDQDIEIEILGMPGESLDIRLVNPDQYKSATINGKKAPYMLRDESTKINIPGSPLEEDFHRKLATLEETPLPSDAEALYEATVFAADNNALEVRSIEKSGESSIPQVRAAQDAFFTQDAFVDRGIWDKYLFDGDMNTGFWPTEKYRADQKVEGGCLRLDLGEKVYVDEIVIHVPDIFGLQPLLVDEGNYVDVSTDLLNWEQLTYLAGKEMHIEVNDEVRYLRFRDFPQHIVEIEGFANGKKLNSSNWRASNLFAYPTRKKAVKAWKTEVVLDEVPKGSYLCVALNGKHGVEGAYAAAKIDGRFVGSPDRASSYPSNPWEFLNAKRDKNYTYYIPVDESAKGKTIEVYTLAYDEENLDFEPELWITAYPHPWEKMKLVLSRNPEK